MTRKVIVGKPKFKGHRNNRNIHTIFFNVIGCGMSIKPNGFAADSVGGPGTWDRQNILTIPHRPTYSNTNKEK